ncbi:carotenoid oxygenase family protein [Pseudoalteromonas luteoviolacea]|uniref:carotenoid oxygenase family protein n=1 Tax=Pseudoalteromonas luteoviolacea TaxID=43657 RepID=UPI001B389C86|nr:carotenoid oxygenase family protein [Pseudoalteromonas luteoviolacea]MBQ4840128.1 carotenoid oxygenase family protein [Pseudoalteromonas luteoviolacea]
MERRQLLKGMLAAPLAHAAISNPCLASNFLATEDIMTINQKRFTAALEKRPELIGVVGVDSNYRPQKLLLEGKLPADLTGSFYRNGPGLHQRAGQRYTHLFEGDGMVHQFHIGNGTVYHQGKFIRTDKFKQEEKAGKFLYSGPDSKLQNSQSIANPDSINTANTNVIPVNGELWALWEAGSATALNSQSLDTLGRVNIGKNTQYEQSLKGLPFSAHPKLEKDGTIWNFGYAQSGHIVLYHLSSAGALKNVALINSGFKGGMVHDFLITKNHILLVLPSLKRDLSTEGLFSSIQFHPQQPMEVLVISKNTLKITKRYELDPGFVFHFGNAWEDQQENIHFDMSLYPNSTVLHHMASMMRGEVNIPVSPAQTVLFSLMSNGKTKSHKIDGISEFPRVYSHLTGYRNRDLFTLSSVESDVWSDSVRRINLDTDSQDLYTYGKDFLVEEHVLVDQNQNAKGGYLIGTALHIPSKRTCLNIFRAQHVADGPICRAWLNNAIPLGFHGNFLPS